jgi:hypothetical protein
LPRPFHFFARVISFLARAISFLPSQAYFITISFPARIKVRVRLFFLEGGGMGTVISFFA